MATVEGWFAALDAGDVNSAYEYISVPLRSREDWDFETFATFWTDRVVGAQVVDITSVSPSTGVVEVTVDLALYDGGTSHEELRITWGAQATPACSSWTTTR